MLLASAAFIASTPRRIVVPTPWRIDVASVGPDVACRGGSGARAPCAAGAGPSDHAGIADIGTGEANAAPAPWTRSLYLANSAWAWFSSARDFLSGISRPFALDGQQQLNTSHQRTRAVTLTATTLRRAPGIVVTTPSLIW